MPLLTMIYHICTGAVPFIYKRVSSFDRRLKQKFHFSKKRYFRVIGIIVFDDNILESDEIGPYVQWCQVEDTFEIPKRHWTRTARIGAIIETFCLYITPNDDLIILVTFLGIDLGDNLKPEFFWLIINVTYLTHSFRLNGCPI